MRNVLGNIPMFNDFVLFVEAEDIHDSPRNAWLTTGHFNMQDHVISVDECLLNFAVRVGIFTLQKSDKLLEAFHAIFCHRIVLYIAIPEIGPGGREVFVIQGLIIKINDILFIQQLAFAIARKNGGRQSEKQ